MSYSFPPDVRQLVDLRLLSGQYGSEDDVLRDALRALVEEDEDLAAVREAIAAWRAGDKGTPLAQAIDEIRRAVETEDRR
ncbi:MAG: type II toxin-antitoxin system ParD family antitoxin [Pirellulaceae bacterium]